MPRALNGSKLFKYLNTAEKFVVAAAGGDTTVAANVTAGATAVSVAATTSFASLDWAAVIGASSSEFFQVGVPATTMPLVNHRLGGSYAIGDRFVELTRIPLGHIEGLTLMASQDLTAIRADTSRVPIGYIPNNGELMASWSMKEFTPLNIQLALGITEAEYGAGTAADPFAAIASGSTLGTQGFQCFRFQGINLNGRPIELFLADAVTEVDFNAAIGTGQGTVLPVKIRYSTLVVRDQT